MEFHGEGRPERPVLHIVVVGFHHKKGCQVEFSYPPINPPEGSAAGCLPEEWRYLPFLALPDGAHNYREDTVYFHLPPLRSDTKCVYGVSCYRQIEAKALKVRQEEVTRETVQKSVCVLSQVPLYGLIQAKLQLITHAYFEEKDFSQVSILKELYDHLNSSLRGTSPKESQVYLGLSPRDLILHFRHKVLLLFKLILLEKKVLFYVSPVSRLVETMMTVISLFPGMIENGLTSSSRYKVRSAGSEDAGSEDSNVGGTAERLGRCPVKDAVGGGVEPGSPQGLKVEHGSPSKPASRHTLPESSESDWETLDPAVLEEGSPNGGEGAELPVTVQPQSAGRKTPGLVSGLQEDQFGQPLAIFTKGYLCLPYMALQQHHLLADTSVRGFVAGATNILFIQQGHLADAIVHVEEAHVSLSDPGLLKLVSPTAADLRFMDNVVRHVTESSEDSVLDGAGWEGGDEWIRAQFRLYLHSLLSSTLPPNEGGRLLDDYSGLFVSAWRGTHSYRVWQSGRHPRMSEISPGHPFQGQYSVSDVKLRLSHSMQNSERGKRIGNAVMTTGRSVVQTGKAVGQSVGEALSSARSAMTSWYFTLAQSTATGSTSTATASTSESQAAEQ